MRTSNHREDKTAKRDHLVMKDRHASQGPSNMKGKIGAFLKQAPIDPLLPHMNMN